MQLGAQVPQFGPLQVKPLGQQASPVRGGVGGHSGAGQASVVHAQPPLSHVHVLQPSPAGHVVPSHDDGHPGMGAQEPDPLLLPLLPAQPGPQPLPPLVLPLAPPPLEPPVLLPPVLLPPVLPLVPPLLPPLLLPPSLGLGFMSMSVLPPHAAAAVAAVTPRARSNANRLAEGLTASP